MMHFLDIGANIGQTFDWYLLKTTNFDNCHIWCFEPSIRHLDHLRVRCRAIMEHNDHSFKITICPFALSDFNGFAPIYETVDSLGDSLFETSCERPVELFCGVVNVAEFINKMIPTEDQMVIKVDAEGNEIKIVNAILDCPEIVSRIHKLMIEFHAITHEFADDLIDRIRSKNITLEMWTL